MQHSPGGRLYLRSRPVGLEGVMQSMLTSFLRHWSMSTALKKATDWGRSCMPNAWANALLPRQKHSIRRQVKSITQLYSGYFEWEESAFKALSRPGEQVCDLKCQGCSVTVFAADEVPHFVVDADAEAAIDLVLLKEPPHGHQHQM